MLMTCQGDLQLNTLTIDTATSLEIVTVAAGDNVADESSPVGSSHSVTLFNRIQAALEKTGITAGGLDLIGVGTGPGSFTGIRIAVTTTRMLAQVLSVPLVGVSSTLLHAVSVPGNPGDRVLVAFDAKKKRVFGALYMITDNRLMPEVLLQPGDYEPETLFRNAHGKGNLYTLGDGIELYREKAGDTEFTHMDNFIPEGRIITDLVHSLYISEPDRYTDFNSVVPMYARKSDAEIMKKIKAETRQDKK